MTILRDLKHPVFVAALIVFMLGLIALSVPGTVTRSVAASPDAEACAARLDANPDAPERLRVWLQDCADALSLPVTTPEPTATPSSTPTVVPTSTPTVAPTVAPTAPVTRTFPGFGSAGYNGSTLLLTNALGCAVSASNIVLDHKRFNCSSGALQIYGANVKITNSVVNVFPGTWGGVQVYGSATIEDTTIQAGEEANPWARETAVGGHDFTLTRVRILSAGDGVDVEGDNITVQDSYIEVRPAAGGHSDGVQLAAGGANVKLLRNTIILTTPSTAPFFWSGAPGAGVVIEGNLLSGGPYSLRIGGNSGAGAVVKDNVIVRGSWGGDGGPYFVESPCTAAHDIHWSGNQLGDVASIAPTTTADGLASLALACN